MMTFVMWLLVLSWFAIPCKRLIFSATRKSSNLVDAHVIQHVDLSHLSRIAAALRAIPLSSDWIPKNGRGAAALGWALTLVGMGASTALMLQQIQSEVESKSALDELRSPASAAKTLKTEDILAIGVSNEVKVKRANLVWALRCSSIVHPDHPTFISADDSILASTMIDDTIKLWDLKSGEMRNKLPSYGPVYSLDVSKNYKYLAVGYRDGQVRVWNLGDGSLITLDTQKNNAVCARFNSDASLLAVTAPLFGISMWSFDGLKFSKIFDNVLYGSSGRGRFEVPPSNPVAFSKDDNYFGTAVGYDGNILVQQLRPRRGPMKCLSDFNTSDGFKSFAFSPDCASFATGGITRQLKLWDMNSGQLIQYLDVPDDIVSVTFSPDSKNVGAQLYHGSTVVWDISSVRRVIPTNPGKQKLPDSNKILRTNTLQIDRIAALFVLSIVTRCGLALLMLPIACKKNNWSIEDWLRFTKAVPNEFALLTYDSELKSNKKIKIYALVALCAPIFFAILFSVVADAATPVPMLGLVFIYIGWQIGLRLARHLRKHSAAIAHLAKENTNLPIVYLRAFKDDQRLAALSGGRTLEEHIVSALLSSKHTVVALGKPGEQLPPVGAQRYYVSNDEWQNVINKWLNECHAVVMIATDTNATKWELEEIFRVNKQSRLLILLVNTHRRVDVLTAVAKFFGLEDSSVSSGSNRPNIKFALRLYDQLVLLKAPNVDWENDWESTVFRNNSELLIGITFEIDGSPILITANERNRFAFQEAVKWHLASRVPSPESHS